jgi:magnesium transporter
MIQNRQFADLRKALTTLPLDSVAEIFTDMAPQDAAVLFRLMPRDVAADIFEYMPVEAQEALMRSLGREQVAAVLNEMDPDDRTALLEELPGPVTQRLLMLLSPEERRIATELLGYPEESVGRIMTPDYVAVREGWTVGEVLDHIRRVGRDKETLNYIYVVDTQGRLIDEIRLREIILSPTATPLAQLMDRQYTALNVTDDQEEAVELFGRMDRTALPVVDSVGHLVGIVTVDDVLDVAQEEATEDMQKMAAVETLEAPYLRTGFFTLFRKRAIWLSVLFVGEMLTATAMGFFEEEISQAVVLTLFIPLIISSGGNSGGQATSLIIRSLAIHEINTKDWWRVLVREIGSGLALGLVLGLIAMIRIVLWPGTEDRYGPHYVMIGWTVALSLVGVVMYGTLIGSMLPLLLRKLGLDPAVSSTPFVATLVDVFGIVIYFSIASLLLRGTLL